MLSHVRDLETRKMSVAGGRLLVWLIIVVLVLFAFAFDLQ